MFSRKIWHRPVDRIARFSWYPVLNNQKFCIYYKYDLEVVALEKNYCISRTLKTSCNIKNRLNNRDQNKSDLFYKQSLFSNFYKFTAWTTPVIFKHEPLFEEKQDNFFPVVFHIESKQTFRNFLSGWNNQNDPPKTRWEITLLFYNIFCPKKHFFIITYSLWYSNKCIL